MRDTGMTRGKIDTDPVTDGLCLLALPSHFLAGATATSMRFRGDQMSVFPQEVEGPKHGIEVTEAVEPIIDRCQVLLRMRGANIVHNSIIVKGVIQLARQEQCWCQNVRYPVASHNSALLSTVLKPDVLHFSCNFLLILQASGTKSFNTRPKAAARRADGKL